MKTKVKFDKAALVDFFATNGEKIVFGIVVLIFFMFVWKAVSCERYDKQPEDIERVVKAAEQKIADAHNVTENKNYPKIENYVTKIEKIIDTPIVATSYKLQTIWEPTVFPPLRKRGEPNLPLVTDLLTAPGHGQFNNMGRAIAGNGGTVAGQDIGKRWIVVTGLVNMEEFQEAYNTCFEDVVQKYPLDDEPQFYHPPNQSTGLSYVVERAEVTDENQVLSEKDWKMPYKKLFLYVEKHAGDTTGGLGQNEPFFDKSLAFPPPRRTDNRLWGEEILHPPEITMSDSTKQGTDGQIDEANPDTLDDEPTGPAGLGGAKTDRGPGGRRSGMGMGRMGGGGMNQESSSPYRLFRFFDFTTEPGKKYRYRVKLYLTNPNYDVSVEHLEPQLAARTRTKEWQEWITTDWSEPSDVITMPYDDSLLLAKVSQSPRIDAEPTGKVTVIHWNSETGNEVFDDFDVKRGMLVDLYDQDIPEAQNPAPAAEPARPRPRRRVRPGPVPKVDYRTGMLVLDLKGGDRLPGRNRDLYQPASMLLFSPDGNLIVRSTLGDKKEREILKDPAKARAGMIGPGGRQPGRGGRGMMAPGMGGAGGAMMPPGDM